MSLHELDAGVNPKGPLAWMAANPVAANLFMLLLLVGGVLLGRNIKQEVFPEFDLDIITVTVPYPGASPEEVEEGVLLAVEEVVRGIDGVKHVTATAREGSGVVVVELLLGTDADNALSDIRSAVDRITSFPQDSERPVISLASIRSQVISLIIYADVPEQILRDLGNQARDHLLQDSRVTLVDLNGIRPLEISVEVSQENLRRYGLTLDQVSAAIRRSSIDLPGGAIKAEGGEILIRTQERRQRGGEFENIVILSQPDGSQVRLGDIANVIDGFRDTDQENTFNGQPAVRVEVFRVGNQTPLTVAAAVHDYIEEMEGQLPPGVHMSPWMDASEIYRDRIDLLMRNAQLGLILVLLVLALFLQIKLAFWVTMGIPISFLGSMLLLPSMGVSINMISLFAFILTLGIVVDDAIVVGEAIFKHRQEGMNFLSAAIAGVREVAVPVIFSVLTTIVAFMPMFFVPGMMGKFFVVIPQIVIAVLLLSLFESLVILPAHLAHAKPPSKTGPLGLLNRAQDAFSRVFMKGVRKIYGPLVRRAINARFLTVAIGLGILIMAFGVVGGGLLQFTFMPKVESDMIQNTLRMPFGTPVEVTRLGHERMIAAAQEVFDELGGEDANSRGIFATLGTAGNSSFGPNPLGTSVGGHLAEVQVFLVPMEDRSFTAGEFSRRWRERIGEIAGAEGLSFLYSTGPSGGRPVEIRLSHNDLNILEDAAARLAAELEGYPGIFDIDDGFSPGKEQLNVRLRDEARALGLTETDLARQLRSSFFGAEAVRQQRGRDEIRVYVRLPDRQRRSERDIEHLLIRTPAGGEIPLAQAAVITRGHSFTEIQRRDGRRIVTVSSDLDTETSNANDVIANLETDVLPQLLDDVAGLRYSFAGEQEQQREAMASLRTGGLFALLGMYALMAIVFKSYAQPLIIMAAIPFGLVGALIGHLIMGYDLSLMSMMGIIALSGIVVNDSLILIAAINRLRAEGMSTRDAIVAGGIRRFRPILLTSLTTFFGLAPMILETSVQARFLIPMALSLGFGVLFATFIILLIVPAAYLIVDDVSRLVLQRDPRPPSIEPVRRSLGRSQEMPAPAGGE